jgi:hypothetical protein
MGFSRDTGFWHDVPDISHDTELFHDVPDKSHDWGLIVTVCTRRIQDPGSRSSSHLLRVLQTGPSGHERG